MFLQSSNDFIILNWLHTTSARLWSATLQLCDEAETTESAGKKTVMTTLFLNHHKAFFVSSFFCCTLTIMQIPMQGWDNTLYFQPPNNWQQFFMITLACALWSGFSYTKAGLFTNSASGHCHEIISVDKSLDFKGLGLQSEHFIDRTSVQQFLNEPLSCLSEAGLYYQQKTTKNSTGVKWSSVQPGACWLSTSKDSKFTSVKFIIYKHGKWVNPTTITPLGLELWDEKKTFWNRTCLAWNTWLPCYIFLCTRLQT